MLLAPPARLRHVERVAEREPDLAGVLTIGQRLFRRPVAEPEKDVVMSQASAVGPAELAVHQFPEFADTHRQSMSSPRRRRSQVSLPSHVIASGEVDGAPYAGLNCRPAEQTVGGPCEDRRHGG